jgi:hypothetical protein
MVLQRTIENLRERPKHEREAVAFWIAVAVVLVLMISWATFFFRTLNSPDFSPVGDAYTQAIQDAKADTAPADDMGWVSNAPQAASANASQDIQIIQEDPATATDYSQQ